MELHKTKNDLSQETREKVVEILNARLADALDLKSQAKQAHWNVKGEFIFSNCTSFSIRSLRPPKGIWI
jgi:DNA-binding ferritin-like protein